MCCTSVWVVWNLRGQDEKVNERSILGRGTGGGNEGEWTSPLMGVPMGVSLGLAMLANLEKGLFAISLAGVARGVAARDYRQDELQGKQGKEW